MIDLNLTILKNPIKCGLNIQLKGRDCQTGLKSNTKTTSCLKEMYFKYKDRNRCSIKMEKNIYHTNTGQKKAAVATSISDKEDYIAKNNIRDEEVHFIS